MDYKVAVLRAPGTNCDSETAYCVESLGMKAEVLHVNRFFEEEKNLFDYSGVIIPGGFSYGDHVRAGALLGKRLEKRFADELRRFSDEGRPVLGICNGFQVLVECGLIPGGETTAALTTNVSSRFECRWVKLMVPESHCIFTKGLPKAITLPVAHGEGRFLMNEKDVSNLEGGGQVALNYSDEEGGMAEGRYPLNPNGSIHDIAGICSESGSVFGLMPHPERAFHQFQHPDWTRKKGLGTWGDGYRIFKNIVDYIRS